MRRINEVEAITQVSFESDISKILISGTNKNALQSLKYRYKKTADYSYHIQFVVFDKLSSSTFEVTLPSGTPLLSKRRKKLGINNRKPQAVLDVVGSIIASRALSVWDKVTTLSNLGITYGGNSYGYWMRFPDGTQICYCKSSVTLGSYSHYSPWFPNAFASTNYSMIVNVSYGVPYPIVRSDDKTAASTNIFVYSNTGASLENTSITLSYIAIGRWA